VILLEKLDKQQIIKDFDIESEYADIIYNVLENDRDILIPNRTIKHARFLIYLLFRKAQHSIKIFSESLNKLIYENNFIRTMLVEKLKENPTLEINIITNKSVDSQSLKKNLEEKFSEKVKFYTIKTKQKKPINHFILIDNKSFRIEAIHKPKKEHDFIGKVNFNEPTIANTLDNLFTGILKTT